MGALSGLRVVDFSTHVAGPYCTKLLKDAGAQVIKVEPLQGDPCRTLPPLVETRGGVAVAAMFAYLNSGKQSVALDLSKVEAAELVRRLVQHADVVVCSCSRQEAAQLGLSYEALRGIRPEIIVTNVTPFGSEAEVSSTDARQWATELLAYARSGWASVNGRPGRPPLKGAGHQASVLAGMAAYVATLAAWLRRRRSGLGEGIHVSALDALLAAFAPAVAAAQYHGEPPQQRRGGFPTGPVRCMDGHVVVTVSRAHFWRDAMNALGLPELAENERYYDSSYRQEHYADVAPLVEAKIAEWKRDELLGMLGRLRVTVGKVVTVDELFQDEHLAVREYFVENDDPRLGRYRFPGPLFRMSNCALTVGGPVPALGEHTKAVLRLVGVSEHRISGLVRMGVVV